MLPFLVSENARCYTCVFTSRDLKPIGDNRGISDIIVLFFMYFIETTFDKTNVDGL